MPRIITVPKSRKAHTCEKCNDTIPAGAPYRHATPYRRSTKIRCMKDSCKFRQSDLSGSYTAPLYDAIDDARNELNGADSVDDIRAILDDVAQQAREVADSYDEANGGWTQNGASDHEEWCEKRDACNDFADGLESWEPSDNQDEETIREEAVEDFVAAEGMTDEQIEAMKQDLSDQAWEEALQSYRDEASDELDNFSV